METLRNPGTNFPVSGLAAIIITIMLLLFSYNLTKIYIPPDNNTQPEPVDISYTQTTEPFEVKDVIDLTQEPAAPTKRDTTPLTTNPPVTTAPIPVRDIARPTDIVITKVNTNRDFQIPRANGYFTADQVEHKPRVLRPVTPIYPYTATINGIEGRVVLRFIVDEDGGVLNPEVVKAEPKGVFEEAALAAIVKYKFMPATIGDKKVKCVALMPIGFKLNE